MKKVLRALPDDSHLLSRDFQSKIRNHLSQLGYKKLGSGVDKSVYRGRDGGVFIVFVDPLRPHEKKREAHIWWMDYCKKTRDPHVLRVSDYSVGTFEGHTLVQAKAEFLEEMDLPSLEPDGPLLERLIAQDILAPYQRSSSYPVSKLRSTSSARDLLETLLSLSPWTDIFPEEDLDREWKSVGPFMESLFRAVKKAPGFCHLDLHLENVMTRGSTLVMVDPFYVPVN